MSQRARLESKYGKSRHKGVSFHEGMRDPAQKRDGSGEVPARPLYGTGHWSGRTKHPAKIGREASEGFFRNCATSSRVSEDQPRRHQMIDKDRIKGAAELAKGKAKEWTGKATGDKKTEVEGKANQVKGKVQNTIGGVKDAMRDK
jgi:uncharacterized protein YjbJ (UPF0337 family)